MNTPISTTRNSAYSQLVETELAAEFQRKSSTDAKAASMVTASGALVTVLAALSAFVGGQTDIRLTWYAFIPLCLAMFAFAVAAFAGVMAGRPMTYGVAGLKTLRQAVHDRWGDSEDLSSLSVARLRVKMIERLRITNSQKVRWLFFGWWSQVAALVMLASFVAAVLA